MFKCFVCALLIAVLLVSCGGPSVTPTSAVTASRPDIETANRENPGERLELDQVRVKGKTTLFEFYSEDCPSCAQMAPVMDYLSQAKPEIAIRKVDIDRPSTQGIDFESPLAQQVGLSSVPYFRIVDAEGKLVAEGTAAKDQVREWYNDAQMAEHAGQSSVDGSEAER